MLARGARTLARSHEKYEFHFKRSPICAPSDGMFHNNDSAQIAYLISLEVMRSGESEIKTAVAHVICDAKKKRFRFCFGIQPAVRRWGGGEAH